MVRAPTIAVVGPGGSIDDKLAAIAYEVGAVLAEDDVVLVCGGLGGVMREAARGCSERGGTSIGYIPGDDPDEGNPFLTLVCPTGLGEARNSLVVRHGIAVLSVGLSAGTLSEIYLALRLGKRVRCLEPRYPTVESSEVPSLPVAPGDDLSVSDDVEGAVRDVLAKAMDVRRRA